MLSFNSRCTWVTRFTSQLAREEGVSSELTPRPTVVNGLSFWGVFLDAFLLVLDVFSDLWSVRSYICRHHAYAFACLQLASLRRLRSEVLTSLNLGYYTDDLLQIRVCERGFESAVSLAITVYGLPYIVRDTWTLHTQLFSILLSIKSLTQMRMEQELGAAVTPRTAGS